MSPKLFGCGFNITLKEKDFKKNKMGWICSTIMVLIVCGTVLASQYLDNKSENPTEENLELILDKIEQVKLEIKILQEEKFR